MRSAQNLLCTLAVLSGACWLAPAAAQPSGEPAARQEVRLGETTVTLELRRFGEGGLRYVNLHEDESTSVAAARQVLSSTAGVLLTVTAQGRRNIDFRLDGQRFEFDPNRIFSDAGLGRTLREFGADSRAARAEVVKLRNAILALLGPDGRLPVVALHNNSAGHFSIQSYVRPGKFWRDAASVSIGAAWSEDDFFLVTTPALEATLGSAGFNVVLQSEAADDDGSLSVFMQRRGRSYVNVEAQAGHLAQQTEMLRFIAERCARASC